MKAFLVLTGLILTSNYGQVFADDNTSVEKVEKQSITNELVNLLNGTYFNLNEKVCQLQRKVDFIERVGNTSNQCQCNETEINEFKQVVTDELHAFSKILSGFENQLRLLQNEQAELRELLGGGDSSTDASTTTTTPAPLVCDSGWISSPEKCYYVSSLSERTDWSTAISRCTAKGAKLVEIQTDEEASFIMNNLPSRVGDSDFIYTGRRRNDDDVWVFVSNDKVVDTSMRTWGDDEPDGGNQQCGCTKQSDNFLMWDCFCTGYNILYICEIERSTTTTTTTTTPAPRVCDSGWISSAEKCYYVSNSYQKTEWSNAISSCTSMGAKLVEFQTDAEAAYLLINMPSYVDAEDYIYTGRKLDDAGHWVFVSNNKMIDTTERTWANGEPDNGIQKCGCTRQSERFLMYDCLCTGHNIFYICEMER